MRNKKPGRRQDIAAAALTVFTRQGYRMTQMADVAREAGVSAGALYSYVEGKEALFELALRDALGDVPKDTDAVPVIGPRKLGHWLAGRLREAITWPHLRRALAAGRASADGHAAAVIGELMSLVGGRRHLVWLLDRCANEIQELAGIYETEVRARYITDFTSYASRCSGLAALDEGQRAATARAVMEMSVWMAMHRQRDRLPPACSSEVAQAATIAAALRILVHRPE